VELVLSDVNLSTPPTSPALGLKLFDMLLELLEVMNTVITHASGLDLAIFLRLHKSSLGAFSAFRATIWTMQ
jgi:hypothetical protein